MRWGESDTLGKKNDIRFDAVDSLTVGDLAPNAALAGRNHIVAAIDAMDSAYVQAGVHELVHNLRREGRGYFDTFSELVVDALKKDKNVDPDASVQPRIREYAQSGVKLSEEAALEKIVVEAAPAALADEQAMRAPVKENRSMAVTIRDFIVRFAEELRKIAAAYGFDNKREEAGVMLGAATQDLVDIAETLDMALSAAQEDAQESAKVGVSETESTSGESEPQFSRKNGIEFATDKYYDSLLDRLEDLKSGSYISVGKVMEGSVLNRVGLPAEKLFFDVSKINKALSEHGDHITIDTLKAIPNILRNPVVIAEAAQSDTVNVFGDMEVSGSPILIGIMVTHDRTGMNVINKVRTIHARRDVTRLVTDESVLYLSENKKRTREWFQARDIIVPLGGTKFGVIRSIAYSAANVNSSAEISTEVRELSDADTKFSLRKKEPPEKTLTAYKVFVAFENKPGQLFPPMVANPNGESTPVGVWLDADEGVTAKDKNGNELVNTLGRKQVKAGGKGTQGGSGALAYRPGWHLGELPMAKQFSRVNPESGVNELFPANFIWAECEIAADRNYQEEAMSYGYNKNGKFQHSLAGLPKLPTDGYYMYRTNPDPTTLPWYITGAMKVTKILSDAETDQILRDHGIEPMKRQGGPIDLEKFGFKAGEVNSEREYNHAGT